MHIGTALAIPVLAATLTAQRGRWEIERDEGLLFSRESRLEVTTHDPEGAEPHGWMGRERDLLGWPGPAVLLGGELDRRRRAPASPPFRFRSLGFHLAVDLGAGRRERRQLRLPAVPPLGAHTVRVEYEPPERDHKRIVAEIRPDPAVEEGAQPEQRVVRGTLVVEREFADDDTVRSFTVALDGVLHFAAHRVRDHGVAAVDLELREDWQADRVADAEDSGFKARVTTAIRDGTEYLVGMLRHPTGGAFTPEEPHSHGTGSGHLALALLAALKGGADPRDMVVAEALDELRGREMTNTYCLATAIMALEALYAPAGERQDLRNGTLEAPVTRTPSERDAARLQAWSDRLLQNIDTTTDPAYVRRWHYHRGTSWDNSNTQYALLGLYAAHLCGVEINPQVWTSAAAHWIAEQKEDEGAVALSLDRDVARGRTHGRVRAVPVGWSYQPPSVVTGSMTAAGITGLTVCRAALFSERKGSRELIGGIDRAVRGGFAWFARNLDVRANPTAEGPDHHWHYYYLYGLERACELARVTHVQGRDWYFEGAMLLLDQHFADGPTGLTQTAFGVLFLKKAALPAVTGR